MSLENITLHKDLASNIFGNNTGEADENSRLYLRYLDRVYKSVESFQEIVKSLPENNCQYRIVTTKSFNAITLLALLLKEHKKIDELVIAIYRMNQQSVNFIIKAIKQGDIKTGVILLSSFFRENKKYEKWCETLSDLIATTNNFSIGYEQSHAKITLIKIANERYVFEGSGNYSDNARHEQYLLENNAESYEFHKTWIKKTVEKAK